MKLNVLISINPIRLFFQSYPFFIDKTNLIIYMKISYLKTLIYFRVSLQIF